MAFASSISSLGLTLVASGGRHGEGHIDWWVLGSVIANAVVFFGALYHFAWPRIAPLLVSRRDNMRLALEEAKQKQADAERRLSEFTYKLEHLEEEVKRIVASYEAEARADRERMSKDTDRAIERLVRESEFTIGQEVRKAEKALRQAGVEATLELAETILRERTTEADRRRLADQYISSLERAAPSA